MEKAAIEFDQRCRARRSTSSPSELNTSLACCSHVPLTSLRFIQMFLPTHPTIREVTCPGKKKRCAYCGVFTARRRL